ncbi:MAG: hypothetical protein ACRD0J_05780 [Acidimicrobiales bacterium]
MKVAVSLPDGVFQEAEALAERLGMNRSQLYARALEAYVGSQEDDPVTRRLDELADLTSGEAGLAAGRALVAAGAWEW